MLTYAPGESLAHRLDPRAKLAVQAGFALAAFAHTTPGGLAALTVLALGMLRAADTSPLGALRGYRFALVVLAMAVVLEALTLGPPWFSVREARPVALAGYRVVLVLLVAAAYVRTTPVRESRAAIQHTVPGRAGQFLGAGVAFVFRFLPVLRADLARIREAMAARLGDERPLRERMGMVAVAGLDRALSRADAFSLALRARCFAWNPTLPPLSIGWADRVALVYALALALTVLL